MNLEGPLNGTSGADNAQGLIPIRDVARLTGVNPVTLRAWERRYGLIVPQRTEKGHRLYDGTHIQRIQDILNWLSRGVSVGQVKPLLEAQQDAPLQQTTPCGELHAELLDALLAGSQRQLEASFNRATALYPPSTLCAHLLLPLLHSLEQRWQGQLGARLEQVQLHGWLRSSLGSRIQQQDAQLMGAPLLLASLSEQAFEPGLWLSAWLASSAQCPVQIIEWQVPATELQLALEHLRPRALLLYANQAQSSQFLQRQLPRLIQYSGCGLYFVGPAAAIHASDLQRLALSIATTPLQAMAQLKRDGLLDAFVDTHS